MAQELTFNITEDRRKLLGPVEAKDFNLKFDRDGQTMSYVDPKNWVQGRIGDESLKQVFVNITEGKKNVPKDVTGMFLRFCGLIYDKDGKPHIVIAQHGSVNVDPQNGRLRFDFPKQAFTVAGAYQQAFFQLIKAGTSECVATLEFDMEVMANFVFSAIVPEDWVEPFNDTLKQLLASSKDYQNTMTKEMEVYKQNISDLYNAWKNKVDKDLADFEDATKADLAAFKEANANDIATFKQQYADTVKAKQTELQNIVYNFTDKVDTLLKDLNQQGIDTTTLLTDLRSQISALQDKIKSDGLFTQDEAKRFESDIQASIDSITAVVNGFNASLHDIEVIDYKPTRDGKAHTLSENYSSVDEAQKDYPAATSLADTKDWCAITAAIREGQKQGKNVYLAAGHYVVNRTITLPEDIKFYGEYQNTRIFASSQMCEDSKKKPLSILEYDESGQPPIYVENIHVLGNNDQANQIIGLHLGGNRASKFTNLIVSNAFAHGTLVYATNKDSADVENVTFEHYWQVQSGSFSIQTNPEILHGNITDFAVYDSQITSLDVRDNSKETISDPSVEIINNDSPTAVKTIYGVEFNRVFLHAQANNLVRIVGNHASRATHSINFDFIKGELHDEHGNFGAGCDKYFIFHLERCRHVMIDHSTQLIYSGVSYVEMVNCAFCDVKTAGIMYLGWQHSDSKIYDIDKLSYENHINIVGLDIFKTAGGTEFEKNPDLGYDYGYAYDAMDLFDRMIDRGTDNHITGWQLAQTLTLNNEPDRLKQITNGKIKGLEEANQHGVMSSLEENTHFSKHVFAKNITDAQQMLMMPIMYKRVSGFLVSMRVVGDPDDIKKLNVLTGSNFYAIPTDQQWHVWTGICPTQVLMKIGVQRMTKEPLKNDVTIEIEYLDSFMENKIPYYPDFTALPAPVVDENNFYENPIVHSNEIKVEGDKK